MPAGTDIMTHSPVTIHPDPSRTVIRPFVVSDPTGFDHQAVPRVERIADRVLAMHQDTVDFELNRVMTDIGSRHHDFEEVVLRRFETVKGQCGQDEIPADRARLIGAYFSQEYAFEAAALFNPSMVPHDDQTGAPDGGIRFVVSLRGIGEGHLSSVTFRTGSWCPREGFAVDPPSRFGVTPTIEEGDDASDGTICVNFNDSQDPSETVLFPVTEAQQAGIEDMRLVRLIEDDGQVRHLGTYTAYSGSAARCELMEAVDYKRCTLTRMTGAAAERKGIAIFPRKVGGRYAALGRQDNENIWFLQSDSLTDWDQGTKIIAPLHFWEFVQMGNCGSPIEIDEGWLVLTHGVGSVRNYCIGAALLDKDDPTKVLGRMALPLVHPSLDERDGYVPNVVYSCGGIVHDRMLLLPYGVADGFTAFAHCPVDDLLAVLR